MNLDKLLEMKQKLEQQLSRGGGGPRANFWQARSGDNRIRVLPSWAKDGDFAEQFWLEVSQHWNINTDQKGPVICAAKTPHLEGACPVCEFIDVLKKDEGNPAAQALAFEIRAKKAFFLNIVDLDDMYYTANDVKEFTKANDGKDAPFKAGDVKLQVYAAPITVFDAIIGLITKTKKDITHLETGRNLTLTKHFNKANPKLTRYEVTPEFDPEPLDLGGTEITDLTKVSRVMSYDDALKLLSEGVGGSFDTALTSGSASASLPKSSEKKADPTDGMDDLEARMKAALAGG